MFRFYSFIFYSQFWIKLCVFKRTVSVSRGGNTLKISSQPQGKTHNKKWSEQRFCGQQNLSFLIENFDNKFSFIEIKWAFGAVSGVLKSSALWEVFHMQLSA